MYPCCADLARRLRAAADGLDYQEDLSDEDDEEGDSDAEISEMEEGVDAYPPATFAEDGKFSPPEKVREDAGGVMNSPEGHPWGAEVWTCPVPFCSNKFETCTGRRKQTPTHGSWPEGGFTGTLLEANAYAATGACFSSQTSCG